MTVQRLRVRLVPVPPLMGVDAEMVEQGQNFPGRPRAVTVTASRRIWLPYVYVRQDGRVVGQRRLLRVAPPLRPVRLPKSMLRQIDWVSGGDLLIGLVDDSYVPFDLRGAGVYLPLCGP
jgi:hypothetical protein